MAPIQNLLCTLAVATTATAFTPTPIIHTHQSSSHLTRIYASSDKGGGSAIATPKTKQVTTTVQKSKQKEKAKQKFKPSEPDQVHDFEDAPMFRLYLIGDEEYDQEHVVTRLHEVVEDCSEDDAATLFKVSLIIWFSSKV